MIKAVRCNRRSFKTVHFHDGFNVVLAERTKGSSKKESRNGLGKSTLIEILHFCLGAGAGEGTRLAAPEVLGWTFTLDLVLNGQDVSASRNTEDSTYVILEAKDFSAWPVQPEKDAKKGGWVLKLADWKEVLGRFMFGLRLGMEEGKYNPSFRGLISYSARQNKAFADPFEYFPRQPAWNVQVHNTFLLGLNWEYASEFQRLKDRAKELDAMEVLAKSGGRSIGSLEAERVAITARLESLEQQLRDFKVLEQYNEIQTNADVLTKKMHGIANSMNISKNLLGRYGESLAEEKDISLSLVEGLYKDAGFIFSSELKKKLDDVLEFHATVIKNRKEYLKSEIARLEHQLKALEGQLKNLSGERAELLGVLQTHGALDEHSKLQGQATTIRNELLKVKNAIETLQAFEEGTSALSIATEELLNKARQDKAERSVALETAMRLFNEYSTALYDEPGTLSVDLAKTGYKFSVDIKRGKSQGIEHMKVFSYDLTLATVQQKRVNHPGFLIHDSTIFDGVDERQIARALQLAATEAKEQGFQYICTINSDVVPRKELGAFAKAFDAAVVRTLTDAAEDTGLLGVRF